jgi:hypothetical protein
VIVVANLPMARVSYHDHETAGSRGTEGAREPCRQRPSGYGERPEANRRVIPLRALYAGGYRDHERTRFLRQRGDFPGQLLGGGLWRS